MSSVKKNNNGKITKTKSKKKATYKCELCFKAFTDKKYLIKHRRIHSKETPFQCSSCDYAGKTLQYLNKHIRVVHTRERKFGCDICGKSFEYDCLLNKHMRVHTGEKPYECDVCGKAFNSRYSFKTHKLIHANLKPFKCTFCPYACRDSSTLRKHKERHMGKSQYFTCSVCDKSFSKKPVLKIHIAEEHFEIDMRRMECDACGKKYKSRATLVSHIKIVHERSKTVKCDICHKTLCNAGNLRTHMRTHVDQRPFACTFEGCSKTYKDASTLKKHSIVHYPEHHFPCKICDKLFSREERMIKHLKTHMAKVKKFECHHCGVRFYNKTYLSTHIHRKHGRKRQKYVCDLCGLVSTNKPSIVMHLKYGHGNKKKLRCNFCKKRFNKHLSLNLHKWTEHYSKNGMKQNHMEMDETELKVKLETIDHTYEEGEPIDNAYDGGDYFEVSAKIETLDDEAIEELTNIVPEPEPQGKSEGIPNDIFEEFVASQKGHENRKVEYDNMEEPRKNLVPEPLTQNHLEDIPNALLEEFIAPQKRHENRKVEYDNIENPSYLVPEPETQNQLEDIPNALVEEFNAPQKRHENRKGEYDNIEEPNNIVPEPEPQDEFEDVPNALLEEFIPAQRGQNKEVEYDNIEERNNIVLEPESQNNYIDVPNAILEEFITPVQNRPQIRKVTYPKDCFVDEKLEKSIQKKVDVLLAERKRKEEEREWKRREKKRKRDMKRARRALERTRRKYNRLIRNAVQNSSKKDKVKIKHGAISAQEQQPNTLLEENFFIQQIIDNTDHAIDEAIIDAAEERRQDKSEDTEVDNNALLEEDGDKTEENAKSSANEENAKGSANDENMGKDKEEENVDKKEQENKGTRRRIEHNKKEGGDDNDVASSGEVGNEKEGESEKGRNKKIKFNSHQCYVCFKLYQTKEELMDHCKEHFNVTNMQTLKKCPLCDYTTNLSITLHLKRKHKIKVKVPYGTFKDNQQSDGSRYYYEVNDKRIQKVEIIPSVKNLNKRASCKIDKMNREKKNKDVLKRKLVKKGNEWIVLQEKIKINFNECLLPKFDKLDCANVKGNYVDNLKELYKEAKKNGKKMLFPCESCDKICQTLAALRLHNRKHEANPKPFKPKVYKHKINKNKGQNKVNKKVAAINIDNRTAKPKPVVNNHKCDKELIEFYNKNIKGADIEFWQFLKIYNKMERENINDFEDLQKSSVFGLHNNEPIMMNQMENVNVAEEKVNNDLRKENDNDGKKTVEKSKRAKNAFTRVVRLSKRELMKRNEARQKLREKIKLNSTNKL